MPLNPLVLIGLNEIAAKPAAWNSVGNPGDKRGRVTDPLLQRRIDLENRGRKFSGYGFTTVTILFLGNSFTLVTFSPMKVTNIVTAGGVP
jgi:hypothetical protein